MRASLGAVLALVVTAFCLSTVPGVRSVPGFDALLDGWLQVGGYVLAAAYAWSHLPLRSTERALWGLIAAALSLRAAGFAIYVPLVRTMEPQPYPSAADAAWLLSMLVLLVGLALRLRVRMADASTLVVLDAAIGAATTASIAIAALYAPLVRLTTGSDAAATATNLAYPVADVAILVLIAGLFAATRFRPPRSKVVLAIGLGTGAVVDSVFVYQVSAGTYRPGTWLAALSLLGTAVAAAAGGLVDSPRDDFRARTPGMWLPAAFAVPLLAVLATPSVTGAPIPLGAVALAAVGLLMALVRALRTWHLERRDADRRLSAAAIETWRFATLVESSQDLVAMSGLDGRITYLNPAGHRLLAITPSGPRTPPTWAEVTAPSELAWPEIERRLRAGEHVSLEIHLHPVDNRPSVPVDASFFPLRHPTTGSSLGVATVMRDVTERVRAERSVRELSEQRRQLLARLVVAQEEERGRIASDVHDDPVQVIAALDLRLAALSRRLATVQPDLVGAVDAAAVELRAAMRRLRHLLFDLDAPVTRMGLEKALIVAAQHVFDGTAVKVDVAARNVEGLSDELRITTYRVVREALVNVRRHAGASHVLVEVSADEDRLVVVVRDDGRGMSSTEVSDRAGHRGLSGMRDRVSAAGGDLRLQSGPDGGVQLRVVLPV